MICSVMVGAVKSFRLSASGTQRWALSRGGASGVSAATPSGKLSKILSGNSKNLYDTLVLMHASLAAIGRATCIEADEPPSDIDDVSDDGVTGGKEADELMASHRRVSLDLDEMTEMVEESERKFIHLPWHKASLCRSVASLGMLHSRETGQVGKILSSFYNTTKTLHVIELQKTIVARLQEFQELVQEVERLVCQEVQLLAALRAGDTPSSASSRLSCIRAICENLRLCKNQLAIVRNSVQQSRPLQLMLRTHLKPLLQTFWKRHHHFEERTLLLTHDLIYLGLQVISHSDLTKYTHNELWEISRGIEEFNALLEGVKQQRRTRLLRQAFVDYHQFTFADFDTLLQEIDMTKPISFSKILFRLASERAQRAVSSIHHFYFTNRDLLRFLKQRAAFSHHSLDAGLTTSEVKVKPAGDASTTSDYHSASSCLQPSDPDLSRLLTKFLRQESPTGDYLRMEYDFASSFLDIISQSTQMLKELHNPSRRRLLKEETFETFVATLPPQVVGNKPARKGVQWSDHKDVSVRHHVIGRYLDLIWREFDRQFELYMALHVHCAVYESAVAMVGSLSGLAPHARLVIADLMQHTGVRELFPPGVLPILQKQADRIRREALVSSWDADMSVALGQSTSDNLSPTMLSGGAYSTRTGKGFLDALNSMTVLLNSSMNMLQTVGSRDRGIDEPTGTALVGQLLSVMTSLTLISTTTSACYRWHQCQITNLLAGWKPGPLQFILHTDLRLILDRLGYTLHLLKRLQTVPILLREEKAVNVIRKEVNQINQLHQALQSLCSSTAKTIASRSIERATEFFRESMPSSRHWRSMKMSAGPFEAQDYARSAMMLLQPVLDAVRALPGTSQITAAAPAVSAVCSAWQQHILKEKLKFNMAGALQLEADVNIISEFLNTFVDCPEVRASLLALTSVQELQTGVRVLKLQSPGSRPSAGGESTDRSTSCASMPCSDIDTSSTQELLDLDEFQFLPNLQDWLALRTSPEEGRKFLPLCR